MNCTEKMQSLSEKNMRLRLLIPEEMKAVLHERGIVRIGAHNAC